MAGLLVLAVIGIVVVAESVRGLAHDSTNEYISMIILVILKSNDVQYITGYFRNANPYCFESLAVRGASSSPTCKIFCPPGTHFHGGTLSLKANSNRCICVISFVQLATLLCTISAISPSCLVVVFALNIESRTLHSTILRIRE